MFLYELALQLGVRSTDLVARAKDLGLDVGPSSFLTPDQVQRLASGGAPTAPPPPGALPMTPPAGDGAPGPPPPGPPAMPSMAPPMWAMAAPTPATPEPGPGTGRTRSPALVALVVAVPVVLLIAALAFFVGGDDEEEPVEAGPPPILVDEVADTDTPNNQLAPIGPSDEPAPIGPVDEPAAAPPATTTPGRADGEVVDIDRFCQAYAWEAPGGPQPTEYTAYRAKALADYEVMMGVLDDLVESSGGATRLEAETLRSKAAELGAALDALPTNQGDVTQAHVDRVEEAARGFGTTGQRIDDAGERYCT